MQTSQLILLIAIVGFIIYVFRVRTVLTDRLIFLVLTAAGAVMVLRPNLTTQVANLIQVGRGADLLLYLFVVASLFGYVGLTSQLKRTERQITDIARELAIAKPLEGRSTSKANEA
ncbi:MAG TPA: DUF2304 domain-containing protein [Vicinamibacterales bacterium]|jgi:hypothetical protein|nr:DUF2304 domain-containing protein [Vicinamibacterales bacterium]